MEEALQNPMALVSIHILLYSYYDITIRLSKDDIFLMGLRGLQMMDTLPHINMEAEKGP